MTSSSFAFLERSNTDDSELGSTLHTEVIVWCNSCLHSVHVLGMLILNVVTFFINAKHLSDEMQN